MPLTDRQSEILTFIERSESPPTAREVAAHFRLSLGTVSQHLEALRAKGVLAPGDRKARGLRAAGGFREKQAALVHVPLYGSIPAGWADERHQEAEGCVSVDRETLGAAPATRLFALRVRGDSMTGRHIVSGDVAVLEHGKEPRRGDVVAALIDGESTLKVFERERGRPVLRAANPAYPDQHPASELSVQGVLVAVIRSCPR